MKLEARLFRKDLPTYPPPHTESSLTLSLRPGMDPRAYDTQLSSFCPCASSVPSSQDRQRTSSPLFRPEGLLFSTEDTPLWANVGNYHHLAGRMGIASGLTLTPESLVGCSHWNDACMSHRAMLRTSSNHCPAPLSTNLLLS